MTPCDKQGYETRQQAIDAIKGICRRDKQDMKVYLCPNCGEFHAATKGKRNSIPVIRHKLKDTKFDLSYKYGGQPTMKKEAIQPLATGKIMTKEMADYLKRLINGKNNMLK